MMKMYLFYGEHIFCFYGKCEQMFHRIFICFSCNIGLESEFEISICPYILKNFFI